MLAVATSTMAFVAPIAPQRGNSVTMETVADLKALSTKLNPSVGYWNPLSLGDTNTDPTTGNKINWWGESDEAAIGFLRHAEIKHGRVAMAAFVGFCVQANGICFPWKLTGFDLGPVLTPPQVTQMSSPAIMFSDISAAGGPLDQWDALPTLAKLQIFGAIAFLEAIGESTYAFEQDGAKHYMRGGTPGKSPSRKSAGLPHPVPLDLWDPLGLTKKMAPERKEKALLAEINNGRLAMIGIFGLISASKGLIVPGLDSLGLPLYEGDPMAYFAASDTSLPLVSNMLENWNLAF